MTIYEGLPQREPRPIRKDSESAADYLVRLQAYASNIEEELFWYRSLDDTLNSLEPIMDRMRMIRGTLKENRTEER